MKLLRFIRKLTGMAAGGLFVLAMALLAVAIILAVGFGGSYLIGWAIISMGAPVNPHDMNEGRVAMGMLAVTMAVGLGFVVKGFLAGCKGLARIWKES